MWFCNTLRSLTIYTFQLIYWAWLSQEWRDGRTRNTHRRNEKCIQGFSWKTWGVETTLETQANTNTGQYFYLRQMWFILYTALKWHREGNNSGFLWTRWWAFEFPINTEFLEQFNDHQLLKNLCRPTMELIICVIFRKLISSFHKIRCKSVYYWLCYPG
jgi:hypothetical protein